eukprot:GHVL01029191.1.p1 GENE.GHVL01029191.1~~GHVL01029191.1.p1  ORF type:complete len:100 (+),score=6.27 GHVL01029191.1:67-366(+)
MSSYKVIECVYLCVRNTNVKFKSNQLTPDTHILTRAQDVVSINEAQIRNNDKSKENSNKICKHLTKPSKQIDRSNEKQRGTESETRSRFFPSLHDTNLL